MTLPLWARVSKKQLVDHSPTILSGLAMGGLVATVALAVRATPQAGRNIGHARLVKGREEGQEVEGRDDEVKEMPKLTVVETVQATWSVYLPAAISGAATLACIIGANQIGLRQKAALAGAYVLAENTFRAYKDEVIKTLGEKKEREVNERVTEREVQANKTDAQVIIVGGEDQLCYDKYTGRYFRSTAEKIRQAEIELKTTILKDMWCDHNYFYHLLDLEDVVLGEALGWNIDHMPEVFFSSHLSPNGTPCLSVEFKYLPKVDYLKY
jgi:hypothetical protein